MKHIIIAYHPKAKGVVERGHKQLVDGLSKACSGKSPAKWPEYLNDVLWADRITVRKSTGFSPFELVYGRKCLLPVEIIFSTWQIIEAHECYKPPPAPAPSLAPNLLSQGRRLPTLG